MKITGAYYGSSHVKLGKIANVVPLESKLYDISARWVSKACRTGDPHIRDLLQAPPTPGFPTWHSSRLPHVQQDGPINSAFSISPLGYLDESQIS